MQFWNRLLSCLRWMSGAWLASLLAFSILRRGRIGLNKSGVAGLEGKISRPEHPSRVGVDAGSATGLHDPSSHTRAAGDQAAISGASAHEFAPQNSGNGRWTTPSPSLA